MAVNIPFIQADAHYIVDLPLYRVEKPYYIAGPLDSKDEPRRTNAVFEAKRVPFHDLRGHEGEFLLQVNGFEYMVDKETDIESLRQLDETTVHQYAENTKDFIKRVFAADHAFCYACKFRSSADIERPPGVPTGERQLPDEPACKAHVDHTLEGGLRRIRRHLTKAEQKIFLDEPERKWRLLIVNTWRPLNGPVQDYPLAICDPTTRDLARDAVATDRVSPVYQGENYYLKYHDEHRWYWLRDQTPDELLVFISFDTERDLDGSFIPHCSFKVPDAPEKARPRESIETRTIAVLPA